MNSNLSFSDPNDPALRSLITQIVHQVSQTLISPGLSNIRCCRDGGSSVPQPPMETSQSNLLGGRLVLQCDVKEPPIFRGEDSDKFAIHDWEYLMDTFLQKRCIPLADQAHRILLRLMGKAKDVVRIALRSNPALKPAENPKVIFDVLRQHFSEIKYSCMPLTDFYSTQPVMGEILLNIGFV